MPVALAVIFDVDGTLVDSERDGHRVAFNRAFAELGLPYRWDVESYGRLLAITGGERRLFHYLTRGGHADTEARELARRVHARKTEIFAEMAKRGEIEPRPGAAELLEDLDGLGIRLAIATTGSRAWVEPLLDRCFGLGRFETIVAGDDAPALKPDPSAYLLALAQLSLAPEQAVAVEDSANGLQAATAAGVPCAVVVNEYTRGQNFDGAALVVEGFATRDGGGAGQRPALDANALVALARGSAR